jgi:two-component system CheB/CheR fusion protein
MDDIEGNRINPGNFLPAAERANLTPEIDRWVIRNTFDWMERNRERLGHLDSASINLSGHSLSDKTFLEFVVHEFEQRQLPRGKICFEITETVAIANLMQAQELFSALSHIGCKFSLDDFGTGMSSYGYLKNLPVDYVKIDGIFVKDIIDDTIDSKLVQSITDIAHAMEIKTIAEFVENEAIYERVKAIGVDYAQGYHIGKAEPLDTLKLGD